MFKHTFIFLSFLFSASLIAQLSGTYSVGPSPSDFMDLTEARDSMNSAGVSGPIRLQLKPGHHGDTVHWYHVKTHPVTIESQNGDTASTSIVVTQFANCDFITFKNLTLIPLAGGPYRFTDQGMHFNKCKGILIDSCLIKGKNKKDYKIGITITDSYGFKVSNSHFVNLELGIVYSQYSTSSSGNHINLNVIAQNKFNTSKKAIKLYGTFRDTTIIQGNIIEGGENGISIETNGTITSFNLTGELLINANRIYNTIGQALNINTTYNGSGVMSITNNMFSGGADWNNYFTSGSTSFIIKSKRTVDVRGLTEINFYNNSIFGSLHYGNLGQNAKFLNNAIHSPHPLALVYGSNPTNHFSTNSFFTSFSPDTLGFSQGNSTISSFSQLGMNNGNIWADPHFSTTTDLHACSDLLKSAGQYSGLDYDFDSEVRDLANPDIGADEFKNSPQPPCGFANFQCTDSALSFRFTDDSPRAAASSWTFSDGTFYTSPDFVKKFTAGAMYQFTLVTSNSHGSDTVTKSIDLTGIQHEIINVTGNTVSINQGYQSYQWYKDSLTTVGGISHTYHATSPGIYSVRYLNSMGCWVWAINSPFLSHSYADLAEAHLDIYPNPVSSQVRVSSEQTIEQIEIFSLTGILQSRHFGIAKTQTFDISHLNSGIYLLKVHVKNQSYSIKLYVVR